MPAAAGAAVIAVFGTSATVAAAAAVVTVVVKGAIVGAIIGAATAAISGDNILKGAVKGGLIGGVTAGILQGGAAWSGAQSAAASASANVPTAAAQVGGMSAPTMAEMVEAGYMSGVDAASTGVATSGLAAPMAGAAATAPVVPTAPAPPIAPAAGGAAKGGVTEQVFTGLTKAFKAVPDQGWVGAGHVLSGLSEASAAEEAARMKQESDDRLLQSKEVRNIPVTTAPQAVFSAPHWQRSPTWMNP